MQNFKQVYADFVKGEADFNALATSLESFLQAAPEQGHKIQIAMAKLHQFNKLSADEFRQILSLIATHGGNALPTQRRSTSTADTAVEQTSGHQEEISPDTTVVRNQTTAPTSPTGRSQFTWTGFGEGEYINLDVGMVIKDRFLLESVIGEGGMGFIFKARDMRKEEAQDRNPYVAIKVLNDSFRQHPEALKALQREARKSQDLSHPNIITVFDFDRDGDNVYMTMELMEGRPLDKFIRTLKDKPIPIPEALRITHEMGLALGYAHSKNIVHSDFKPGNVFLVKDDAVKVFDFGIARASKQGLSGAQGEMTRFDAGTLGALTPAYASLEMMLGEEPDPRDDIYALACVCHELLTGRHPFDKKSADLAMANKMVVAPIKGLDRKQMRGLLKGLAFKREDRSSTIEEFLEDIRKVQLTRKQIGTRVVAGLAVLAVLGAGIPFYLEKRTIDSFAATLQQGSAMQVGTAFDTLEQMEDQALRNKIISNVDNQQKIIGWIGQRINEMFNLDTKQYDYRAARSLIDRGLAFYRDSASLKELSALTDRTRDILMVMLDSLFTQAIQTGKLLDDGSAESIPAVLAIATKVEPDSYLLKDKRLPDAYLTAARGRFTEQHLDDADKLVNAGLERFNDDIALINMQDQILAERQRLEQIARVAALSADIDAAIPMLSADSDVSALSPAALELRGLDPGNPNLERLFAATEAIADAQLATILPAKDWEAFDALLARNKQLASPLWLARKRGQLATVRGQAAEAIAASRQELAALLEKTALQLEKSEFTQAWEASIRILLQDADAVATVLEEPTATAETKQNVARVYVEQGTAVRNKNRFTEAEKMLAKARSLAPDLPELIAEAGLLNAEMEKFELARLEALRIARIDALKQSILTQTRADDVKAARKSFDDLAALAPDEPFLVKQGRKALVDSYARAAKTAAQQKQYGDAVAYANAGLELMPDNAALKVDLKRYNFELKKSQVIASFLAPTAEGILQAEQTYIEMRTGLSDTEIATLQNDITNAIALHIKTLAEKDATLAHLALPEARRIFGDVAVLRDIVLPEIEISAPVAIENTEPEKPEMSDAELLMKQAEEGDIESQFTIAANYYSGHGVERDYMKAAEWYEKVGMKPASAIKAEKGKTSPVVLAQTTLAGMYFEGKGVPKDMKKAFEWHKRAAENGWTPSQNVVATYYLDGKDIPQDYAEAFKWFTKASKQGHTDSQSGLGLMYFQGWGVAQDLGKAHELFSLAGKKGDVSSQSALGAMYFAGMGVPKDLQKSYMWMTVAIANGYKDEQKLLDVAAAGLTPEQVEAAKSDAASMKKAVKRKKK